MKAVDPTTLHVSVISSSFAMTPKTDTRDDSPVAAAPAHCNGATRLKHSVNSSPAKENSQVLNGSISVKEIVQNGTSLSNGSSSPTKLMNIPFSRENSPVKVNIKDSCVRVNGSVESVNLQNCALIELPLKVGVSAVDSSLLTTGMLNGYYQGDDESSNEKRSLESLTDGEVEDGKRSSSTPEDIPRMPGYQSLHVDSGLESAASSWDRTVAEVKEHAVARLQEELHRAREALKLRDEEVVRLSRIRQEVESELEDLTASLFQEAHNMVRCAEERRASAERAVRESQMQVEVLTAEVAALKTLVLTSTPSRPNPHLHPQIDPRAKLESDNSTNGPALFRKHRRSPSHFNLKYGRENSPPESPVKECRSSIPPAEPVELRDGMEVDPVMHREFLAWKENPTIEPKDPFINRIYREDIDSCLAFSNSELAIEVRKAIETGTIYIEAVNEKSRTHFPKKCALLEAPRQCLYRMRLGETDVWNSISQICRNRIIAVCDFLNYLKYIQRGLVKSSVHDIYWEIVRLRREMVLARLGLPLST